MHVCMHACVCVCVFEREYVCVRAYMCVCMDASMPLVGWHIPSLILFSSRILLTTHLPHWQIDIQVHIGA